MSGSTIKTPTNEQEIASSWSERLKIYALKLRLLLAFLIGGGIAAGGTYALVRRIQHHLATTQVDANPDHWIEKARTEGYDACYYGCDNCHNLTMAYKACWKTAQAVVPGVPCAGIDMWNWASRDRYPAPCLRVLGDIYRADELAKKKLALHGEYALIILTVLAGLVGALVVYSVWPRLLKRLTSPEPRSTRDTPASLRSRRIRGIKKMFFWRGASAASMIQSSNAFDCWGYSPKADQYFANINKTVSGVIHGWTSGCHDGIYHCGQTCSISGTVTVCLPKFCDNVRENITPEMYVNWTAPGVNNCGFWLVDKVEDDVSQRIGNPSLEKAWKVTILVNRYNLTDVTDPGVMCLFDIGNHTATHTEY